MILRRTLRVILIVLVIAALRAIVPWLWTSGSESARDAVAALNAWRDSRPPRNLPLRAGDLERYPRRGFGMVFECEPDFRVDTFAGTASNPGGSPDTTIRLRLSDAQLDTLYGAVIRMRFFDYPEPHPPIRRALGMVPSFRRRLLVRAGGATKTLAWETGVRPESPIPDAWKRVYALARLVARMVEADPAYRSLPSPRGGYM